MESGNIVAVGRQALAGQQVSGHREDLAQRFLDKLETGLESGKINPDNLRQRLERRFGEAAAQQVVDPSGNVDFDKLAMLIRDHRMPPVAKGDQQFGIDPIKMDPAQLQTQRTDKLLAHLDARFGDQAPDVLQEDGRIDFRVLLEFLTTQAEDGRGRLDPGSLLETKV